MRHTLYIIPIIIILTACRTTQTTHQSIKADTIYISQYKHDTLKRLAIARDTLILRDSLYTSERQRGDTIIITQYRDRITYRDHLRLDTVYRTRVQHDTINHTARDTLTQTITPKTTTRHKTRELLSLALFLLIALYTTVKLFDRRRLKNNRK